MRRVLVVVATWLAITIASTVAAWACTCVARDPRSALRHAEAAFVGTLERRDEPRAQGDVISSAQLVGYHFRVERWVKGDGPTQVTVYSALHGASCGLGARPGQRVGLLLQHDGQGRWLSGLCSQFDPDRLLEASRFPLLPVAVATGLLAAVATAARRSVRRSGWTAAHSAFR